MSVWDPMKKMKMTTFSTLPKKMRCKVGDKVVNLREDQKLLARFLVVQQSRPSLTQSLHKATGKFEFSVIPRSFFSSDGLLLIPSDKSAIVDVIERYKVSKLIESRKEMTGIEGLHGRYRVCIIDAMAVVQAIQKGPSTVTCLDFAAAFVQSIQRIVSKYDEGRVIFDHYIPNSLNDQTHAKRSAGIEPVKFEIKDSTNIKLVNLKIFLSNIEIKAQLTRDFAIVYYTQCCNL